MRLSQREDKQWAPDSCQSGLVPCSWDSPHRFRSHQSQKKIAVVDFKVSKGNSHQIGSWGEFCSGALSWAWYCSGRLRLILRTSRLTDGREHTRTKRLRTSETSIFRSRPGCFNASGTLLTLQTQVSDPEQSSLTVSPCFAAQSMAVSVSKDFEYWVELSWKVVVFLSWQLDGSPEHLLRMESSLSLQLLSKLFIALGGRPFSVWYFAFDAGDLDSVLAGKAGLFAVSYLGSLL